MLPRAPVVALSHGGGPMPLLGDPSQAALTESMRTRIPALLKIGKAEAPRAVIIVTAHWQESRPTVSSGAKHELLYDYYGFPPESYEIKHNAPGAPDVAAEVFDALADAGLQPRSDTERGWDHGVFVPMKLIDPSASVPIVQLSVLSSEDPAAHFAMGRALTHLRDRNVAIVGSGFASMHNTRAFFSGATERPDFVARNREWSSAVMDAVSTDDMAEREKKFAEWRRWPHSYEMHPDRGADHFLPLIVCAGAGEGAAKSYVDFCMGLDMYSYYWE